MAMGEDKGSTGPGTDQQAAGGLIGEVRGDRNWSYTFYLDDVDGGTVTKTVPNELCN